MREKQQKILDSFNKVDKSFKENNKDFKNQSLSGQIELMEAELNNSIPDSLLLEVNNTRKKLELAINNAQDYLADKPDENTAFSNLYFITQKNVNEIHLLLEQYETALSKAVKSPIIKFQDDSIMQHLVKIPRGINWTEMYFKDVPVVGAITMLNKFKSDVQKAFVLLKNSK